MSSTSRASGSDGGRAEPGEHRRRGRRLSPIGFAITVTAVVAVLGITAVALIGLMGQSPAALQVGDWTLTRDDLARDLDDVVGNPAYRAVRQEQGSPLPDEDGPTDPALVAELLTDRLTFRLARVALDDLGAEVTDDDRAAARASLLEALVGSSRLAAGPDATLDSVLDQFGGYGEVLAEGVGHVEALRRVLVARAVADGADPADLDETALLVDVLRTTADLKGVAVAEDLGRYDPAVVAVVVIDGSGGALVPVGPEELEGPGTAPGAPTTVAAGVGS